MSRYLGASLAIFRRDLQIFFSYRTLAFSQAFSSIFSIAMFYYLSRLLNVHTFTTSNSYFSFVVVGLVILAVIQSTLTLSTAVRAELVAGTFERVLLSPFGPVRGAMSMMIFPMVQAMVMAVWTLIIATIIFGLNLHWATVPLALPVAILAALAFSTIALLVATVVILFKQAPGVGMVIAGITLVSGFYFPTNLLPPWVYWLSEVQPFTPAVDLLRHLLVGLPIADSAWVYVLKLLGFVLVLLPIGIYALTRGIEIGQRKGTIIEY